jgi:cell shape-determining protein MreC
MGNLTTIEKQYPGARMSSLNKTMGANAGNHNLFLKNIFTEQHSTPQKMVNMQELEQLKQANQQLRERIGMKQSGHHKPLVAV